MPCSSRIVRVVPAALVGIATAIFAAETLACWSTVPKVNTFNYVTGATMENELKICRDAVEFRSISRPSLEGFRCRRTSGPVSIWIRENTAEVIVVDLRKSQAIRIGEFPLCYGPPKEAGWSESKDFYVQFAGGKVVYLNPYDATVKWIGFQPLR